jgi:tetratricopeptide (TPR) repeat protein
MRYFSRVIEIDAENYMALFNLGVVCSQMERDEEAVAYFEKAHRVAAKNLKQDADNQANGYDVSHDLLLPLGRLYCRTGKYREAVDLLAVCAGGGNCRSLEIRKKNQRHGGVLRYLGKAYKQLGMHQEAMAVLQRAIHHNPHDATSLSLLGELYCLENQGVEIALSLCGRAIEFDETRSDYWYRLGWVCVQCGRYEDARNALEESIVRDRKDLAAKYLLGVVYQHLADRPRAEKMFKQILKQRPSCKKAITALVKVRNG